MLLGWGTDRKAGRGTRSFWRAGGSGWVQLCGAGRGHLEPGPGAGRMAGRGRRAPPLPHPYPERRAAGGGGRRQAGAAAMPGGDGGARPAAEATAWARASLREP